MMYIKIHTSYRNVVAICDADLIGKKFEEGKRQLDCRENFYKDIKVTSEEAIKIIKKQAQEDATFNIVGKKSVQAAVEAGLIDIDSYDTIKNIPFALVLI